MTPLRSSLPPFPRCGPSLLYFTLPYSTWTCARAMRSPFPHYPTYPTFVPDALPYLHCLATCTCTLHLFPSPYSGPPPRWLPLRSLFRNSNLSCTNVDDQNLPFLLPHFPLFAFPRRGYHDLGMDIWLNMEKRVTYLPKWDWRELSAPRLLLLLLPSHGER